MDHIQMEEFAPLAIELLQREQQQEQQQHQQHSQNSTLRKNQIYCMKKVHILSTLHFLIVILEWTLITLNKDAEMFSRTHNYLSLIWIFIIFIMMMLFLFFYNYMRKYAMGTLMVVSILTTQCGGVILYRPIADASFDTMLRAGTLLCFVAVIFMILSLSIQMGLKRKLVFFTEWTLRFYVFSFMSQLVFTTLGNAYFDAAFEVGIMFFLAIFIFSFGQAIASPEFFAHENFCAVLLAMLAFFNYITLYSVSLIFFVELQRIFDS